MLESFALQAWSLENVQMHTCAQKILVLIIVVWRGIALASQLPRNRSGAALSCVVE